MKKTLIILGITLISFSQANTRVPPPESQKACASKPEDAACSFESPKGKEIGTCAYTPDNQYYSCRPNRGKSPQARAQSREDRRTDANPKPQRQDAKQKSKKPSEKYSIEQATSDNAQLHTISFAALSFMSSNLCDISFLPPGKHASYFGFQYLRDVVGGAEGHEQNFVPTVANNLLYILSTEQKQILIELAKKQQEKIKQFALMRFPLLISFDKFAKNQLTQNGTKLNKTQIIQQSGKLYALDGELSYERAIGFAKIVNSLSPRQKTYLNKFKTMSFNSWPKREDQLIKREFNHEVHVALMTYASELLSWYVGDIKKDTYFTPERTASYFGAYWTKAAPMKAVKRDNYRISTALTGDSGATFLSLLNNNQKSEITNLIELQKPFLMDMVKVRESIAAEIRKIYAGETNNLDKIVELSRKFGQLDGEIAYLYANAFSSIKNNLSSSQLTKAVKLRNISQYQCTGAFIYAEPSSVPDVGDISSFFE